MYLSKPVYKKLVETGFSRKDAQDSMESLRIKKEVLKRINSKKQNVTEESESEYEFEEELDSVAESSHEDSHDPSFDPKVKLSDLLQDVKRLKVRRVELAKENLRTSIKLKAKQVRSYTSS